MRLAPRALTGLLLALAPAVTRAGGHRCVERSDIVAVGLSTCSRYGWWDTQRLPRNGVEIPSVSVDTSFRAMLLSGRAFDLCEPHGRSCRAVQPLADGALGRWAYAGTGIVRVSVVRLGPIRIGTDMEVGGSVGSSLPGRSDQLLLRRTALQFFSMGLFVRGGFAVGPFALQLDTILAGSLLMISVDDLTDPSRPLRATSGRFDLRPRLTLQYFVHPQVALELFGGSEVLHRDELQAGFGVAFYLGRSYDGLHDGSAR